MLHHQSRWHILSTHRGNEDGGEMRKRHRWIDKRRHRQALGLKSPAEFVHMMNRVKTDMPGWEKAMIKTSRRWAREICVAFQVPARFWK